MERRNGEKSPASLGGVARRQGAISWQLPSVTAPRHVRARAPACDQNRLHPPPGCHRNANTCAKCRILRNWITWRMGELKRRESVSHYFSGSHDPRAAGLEAPLGRGSHPSQAPSRDTAAPQARRLLRQPLGHKAESACAAPGGPALPVGHGGIF